jgi:hypothetical protein
VRSIRISMEEDAMKKLIALVVGAGALGAVAAASPAFATDTYNGGYASSPTYIGGPMDIIAMPFRVVAAPFQMFQPANGALGPTEGALVPVNPGCGVWHDFNGRYTAMCGL